VGLLDNGSDNASGAQTERRGGAGPVGGLLGGKASPAAFSFAIKTSRSLKSVGIVWAFSLLLQSARFVFEELLGFRAEATQFLVAPRLIVHPFDCLAVPITRFLFSV